MDENLSRVLGEIFANLWYLPEIIILPHYMSLSLTKEVGRKNRDKD